MRHTDGTYLLYTILPSVFETTLHYSKSLSGPWTSASVVLNGSNPAPYVMANSSIIIAYKTLVPESRSAPEHGGLSNAVAADWRGPFTTSRRAAGREAHQSIEDIDQHFDRWYILLHIYDQAKGSGWCPGAIAYSGTISLHGPWHLDPRPAWPFALTTANATVNLAHRERPKLLSAGGRRWLFNAATLQPVESEAASGVYGKTFTAIAEVLNLTLMTFEASYSFRSES